LKFLEDFENTGSNLQLKNHSKKVDKVHGKYFGMVIAIIFCKVPSPQPSPQRGEGKGEGGHTMLEENF